MRCADGGDPGGEPLISQGDRRDRQRHCARKKFVSLCTNALLLEKKLHLFEPSPYLFFSVHLDGLKDHHDKSVCQEGVFERAVSAIQAAKAKGFIVNVNATIYDGHPPQDIAAFLDFARDLGVRRLDLARLCLRARARPGALPQTGARPRSCSATSCPRPGQAMDLCPFALFLDFLAGNQTYHCTPWGMPTRNVLRLAEALLPIGEGYVPTFKELMEPPIGTPMAPADMRNAQTAWRIAATSRPPPMRRCSSRCKALRAWLRGPRTDARWRLKISLDAQRRRNTCTRTGSAQAVEIRTAEAAERANKAANSRCRWKRPNRACRAHRFIAPFLPGPADPIDGRLVFETAQ